MDCQIKEEEIDDDETWLRPVKEEACEVVIDEESCLLESFKGGSPEKEENLQVEPKSDDAESTHEWGYIEEPSLSSEHQSKESVLETNSCGVDEDIIASSSNLETVTPVRTDHKHDTSGACKDTFSQQSLEGPMRPHTSSEACIVTEDTRKHSGSRSSSGCICEVCGKTFSESCYLTKHLRTHTGEKPYVCEVCKKSFSQNGSLKTHMRIHTGEKPFGCTTCKKAFAQKCTLVAHMRTHTGEKPFECSLCERTFSQKCSLEVHKRAHTGEKPHVCEVCKKGFSDALYLKAHMRTHTGEKPYVCEVCHKSFYQKCVLEVHKKRHT